MLIALGMISACHKALPSIRPEELHEARLVVAAGDHIFDVVAGLRSPSGYELMQGPLSDFELERRLRDPGIGARTAVDRDLATYEPDESVLMHCDSSDGWIARVLREEPRADGRVRVCEHRRPDRQLASTVVIRDLNWRGHHFQCWVAFWVSDDLDEPYDEGKPSDARLADAIAICDSFTIREMTPADIDRFYPLVNGHRPYTPETH